MYKTLPPIFPIFRSIHKHVDFWSTICWHYVPDELHVFIQTLEGTNGQAPTGKTCRNKWWNRQFFLHIQFSGSHHQKFPEWREFSMRMMGNFGCEGKHARRPIRWLYTWKYDFWVWITVFALVTVLVLAAELGRSWNQSLWNSLRRRQLQGMSAVISWTLGSFLGPARVLFFLVQSYWFGKKN